jgi:hypothetical protein
MKIDHATIASCGVGLRAAGQIQGTNWNFSFNSVDFETRHLDDNKASTTPFINVHGYYSEGAGRMADFEGFARLMIDGGQFQITSNLNPDGKIIKNEGNWGLHLLLRAFRFTQVSAPRSAPYLALRSAPGGASDRHLQLDGITGWDLLKGGTNGIDMLTRHTTDRFYIFFREATQSASATPSRVAQNLIAGSAGANWDIGRFDVPISIATPQQISSNQDDFDPSRSPVWRLSSDTSRTISGIGAGWSGRTVTMINVGGQDIVLLNQNAGSAAANRIITATGGNFVMKPDGGATLIYDQVSSRWRVLSSR